MAESTQQHCVRDDVNVCQLCGELENLSVCGGCKGAWYCSKSHQKQDWKKHKLVCKRKETDVVSVNRGAELKSDKNKAVDKTCIGIHYYNDNDSEKMTRSNESPEGSDRTNSSLLYSSDSFDKSKTNAPLPKCKSEGVDLNKPLGDVSSGLQNNENRYDKEHQIQFDLKTKIHQPKTYKKNRRPKASQQQRYYLDQTTQVLDLPPSISELSRNHPPDSPKPDTMPSSRSREQYLLILQARFNEVSKYVVKCLTQYGICVVDKFLGDATCEEIFKEAIQLKSSGVMNQGQLVKGPSSSSKNKHIRGDIITWLDGAESECQNIHYLISCMDTVMQEVAKSLDNCNINERTKAMVACYPGKGRGYIRHIDNPNKDGRCVTCIYYLNKDWDVRNDGGLLRIYPEGSDQVANIEPVRDRLLFFWSDRRNPHEVEKALRERYAITVWYYDAEERAQALKRLKEGAST